MNKYNKLINIICKEEQFNNKYILNVHFRNVKYLTFRPNAKNIYFCFVSSTKQKKKVSLIDVCLQQYSYTFPVHDLLETTWKWLHLCSHQTEDVFKETAAVHVVVLCLLRGLALLPPTKPQQLLLCRGSVSLCVSVLNMDKWFFSSYWSFRHTFS